MPRWPWKTCCCAAMTMFSVMLTPAPADAQTLTCDEQEGGGRCRLELTPAVTFDAAAESTVTFPNGSGFAMYGDVVLHTPAEDFHLLDAELVFEPTDAGETLPYSMHGFAQAPLDELNLTGGMVGARPVAAVGLVTRNRLRELLDDPANPLPLAVNPGTAEPVYFFFHFATGVQLDFPLAAMMGLDTSEGAHDPFQYAFPGDVALTMIFDPTDPYFYVSSDARTFVLDRSADNAGDAHADAREEGTAQATNPSQTSDDPADRNHESDAEADGDQKDAEGPSLGSFAVSRLGGISFNPQTTWGLPEGVSPFAGQLYVETEAPLGYGITISGPIVTYAGPEGFEQGGNGDVVIGFEVLGDVLGMEFPLGAATAGYGFRNGREFAYFSGVLAPDTSFLPPAVPIVPRAEVQVAAYIDSAHLADTRLRAHGKFDLDADALGKLCGLDLNELFVREGELVIDRHGFWLTGRTATNIHPELVLGSEAVVEAFISADRFADSYILIRGDLRIGGAALGTSAEARLTGAGLFIDGAFSTPLNEIMVHGEITADGPLVAGELGLRYDLTDLHHAQQQALREIEQAQADVDRLEHEIQEQRRAVQAERDRDSERVRTARAAVESQQSSVNGLQRQIDNRRSQIAGHRRTINNWNRWYKRQSWWKKTWAWGKFLAKTSGPSAAIARLGVEIGALETAKATASAGLTVAQATLREVERAIASFPVDADPRVAGLIAARETARATLKAAQAAVGAAPVPAGVLTGRVTVEVSVAGARGSFAAAFNGRPLAGGRAELSSDPAACVSIAAAGEVCMPF